MRRLAVMMASLLLISFLAVAYAENQTYLVFEQVDGNKSSIYIANEDGSSLRRVVFGNDLSAYAQGKHLLYILNQQLYEYFPQTDTTKLIHKFKEKKIALQLISGEPDQALVMAADEYYTNWYILDFADGNLRKVPMNPGGGAGSGEAQLYSPDRSAVAHVKMPSFEYRFSMTIQVKNKTVWASPKKMTVIPDVRWAPDSKRLAFYGRDYDGNLEGFYSLYLLELDSGKLKQIQEKAFSMLFLTDMQMGPFAPAWSKDGKTLLFQYQPFGTPEKTAICQYQVVTGAKTNLTESSGRNEYPTWSPGGDAVLFLSNRETKELQLYAMDARGGAMKRISPDDGHTLWAIWYQPEK